MRTVLKLLVGVTVVFVVLCSVLHPFQTNFPVYRKTLYRKTKNLLKTNFVIETKYLKILHGTVVNGVQDRMSLFITFFANAQFAKPEVMMVISRAHIS